MNKPPFKVIAVDMDGTFLDDQKQYNRQLFEQVLDKCDQQDVRFVVATGDPLPVIYNYFKEYGDQVTIVSENGAQISRGEHHILTKTLDRPLVSRLIAYLVDEMGISPVLSGTQAGYFKKQADPQALNWLHHYYVKLNFIDNWHPLPDDEFFQASFLLDDEDIPKAATELRQRFGEVLDITPSGNGSMDITQPGVNKGWALQHLLDDWDLAGENLAAFGDGGNDISMLKLAQHSFAMPNGGKAVKQVADQEAIADNNHDGVLRTILNYFD